MFPGWIIRIAIPIPVSLLISPGDFLLRIPESCGKVGSFFGCEGSAEGNRSCSQGVTVCKCVSPAPERKNRET
jgi:hypothetical protein